MQKSFIWLSSITAAIAMLLILVVFEKVLYSGTPESIKPDAIEVFSVCSGNGEDSGSSTEAGESGASVNVYTESSEKTAVGTNTGSILESDSRTVYALYSITHDEGSANASADIQISFYNNGKTHMIALEEYVLGVLIAEMPADFDISALKAQAVAIRSYALRKQLAFEDVQSEALNVSAGTSSEDIGEHNGEAAVCGDSKHCCAYISPDEYQNQGADAETKLQKLRAAVENTKGEVLTYNGMLIDAVFHCRSYKTTESAKNIWGYDIPYLQAVETQEEDLAKTEIFDISELCAKLGLDSLSSMQAEDMISQMTLSRTSGGRIKTVTICGISFSGAEIRSRLSLLSTMLEMNELDGKLVVTSHGSGHGVGMSQYGANAMGKAGYDYKEILFHYYQSCKISLTSETK